MKNKIEQVALKRGYTVTEDGQLFNPNGKEISTLDGGYYKTSLKVNKIKRNLKVHRLQAYQKYGDKLFEEGIVVRHKNGNPLDNSWDNILIGTNSDNMMDIPKQIRIKRAKHATSFVRKYNKEEVIKFHKKEKSYKLTMEKFGISSKGTLHYILKS